MDRATVEVYEDEGADYARRRGVQRPERAQRFAAEVDAGALRLDLGCGPGHYVPLLGEPCVAADAAWAMAAAAATQPVAGAVQADLADLPFARRSFGGVWASKAHQHIDRAALPMALADLHRVLVTGGRLFLTMFSGHNTEEVTDAASGDDLPGRFFAWWEPDDLATVVEAAGFTIDALDVAPGSAAEHHRRIDIEATATLALPDHVGPNMALLCCGLNPSVHAAEAGVGFVSPSNRFWKATAAAGLSTRDRDPRDLLRSHGIGMTDLVKRATPKADVLRVGEYREGMARLERLCEWLQPGAVAFVGLAGWRAAVDRKAIAGWQPQTCGGRPVYVLPSTSGLNAGTSLDDLVGHLQAAAQGPVHQPPPDVHEWGA